MPVSVSLRRTLRKLPEFRVLSGKDLDAIIAQIIFKEYKSGDVLWRTGTRLDFLGIIQSGEIIVERQIHGTVIRSGKLSAGDIVRPRDIKGRGGHASILARAVTDVRFCVLSMEQFDLLLSKRANADTNPLSTLRRNRHILGYGLWTAIIALFVILVSWRDISRILSGVLYLESEQTRQPAYGYQRSVKLLTYAEYLDHGAAFAHNQEGFIWYQQNDLRRAEAAFMRVLDIDAANGLGLNNLSVTYLTTGQIQQAVINQKKAAQNDPDSAVVHYNLGLILMKQNYNTEAIREFTEASYIRPDWVMPHLQQGFNYLQMQDYAKAEEAASVAIKLDPDQQSAYMILAIALYKQDRNQEALSSMERALQLNPTDNVARFYEALVLSELGEFDSALLVLEQLLESTKNPDQAARIAAEIDAIYRFLQNHQAVIH